MCVCVRACVLLHVLLDMSLRIDEVHKGQQPEAAVDTEFEEVCACVCACVLLHRLLGMSLRIDEVQCIRSHLHGI